MYNEYALKPLDSRFHGNDMHSVIIWLDPPIQTVGWMKRSASTIRRWNRFACSTLQRFYFRNNDMHSVIVGLDPTIQQYIKRF